MWILGVFAMIVFPALFFDWHARMVFMARVYPRRYGHGKSWNRAHKHYKTNWTFWQRLFWIPVFKEHYEDKYRLMAYLSYAHDAFALVMIISFLVDEFLLSNVYFWHYMYGGYIGFFCLRYIHSDAVA